MPRLNILILTITRIKKIWGCLTCVSGAPRQRKAQEEAHLRLGVGPQPGEGPGASQVRHPDVEFVSQDDGQGHALFCLIGGIAEHQTLKQGTGLSEPLALQTQDFLQT